jgi:hypothetical protein
MHRRNLHNAKSAGAIASRNVSVDVRTDIV